MDNTQIKAKNSLEDESERPAMPIPLRNGEFLRSSIKTAPQGIFLFDEKPFLTNK